MPWCPECRTEYREGYSICADCHVPLVDELHDLPDMESELEWPPVDLGEPVLLATLVDVVEANKLVNLLRENKIPSLKKGHGTGGYLEIVIGANFFGTEIYVPQQMLRQAQELNEALHPPQGVNELPILDEDSLDDYWSPYGEDSPDETYFLDEEKPPLIGDMREGGG